MTKINIDIDITFVNQRSSTSPLEDSTSPIPSIPPPSGPSNEAMLLEEEDEGLRTSIAENVEPIGDSSYFQGRFSFPTWNSEEIPIDLPFVQEPPRPVPVVQEIPRPLPVVQEIPLPIRDNYSQTVKSPSDILPPLKLLANRLMSHPSNASTAFFTENMNILKQAVLEYTSFMDMDIVNASATSQHAKFEHLSNQMAQTLELPSLRLSVDLKVSLSIVHQEISVLLARNVELKAKKTQYFNAVNEKESIHQEIEKAKSNLNEISSDVMVEDSLMMSLTAQMKEIQQR
ncbi:Uncharacterized protein Adt_20840 [Abeliophyllum distichum]|uniref:Uncharacterized protein n=1 Tax=Abeliophyllum distichum TaxID=126358 RepID=A0ABD1SXQ1_9LAMI